MVKDRLASFRRKANIRESVDIGDPHQVNGGNDAVIDMEKIGTDITLNSILMEVNEIKILIDELAEDVTGVKILHKKILSASSNKEEKKRKEELTTTMDSFKNHSKVIQSRLKSYMEAIESEEHPSSAPARARRTHYFSLFQLFIKEINDCQLEQVDFMDRQKSKLGRLLDITGSNASVEDILEQENFSVFTEGLLTETEQAKQTLNLVESVRDDILKLESSIIELHRLFLEMSLLVESQGEIIDRIDAHVSEAAEFVEDSAIVLKKAQEFQTSSRKKKICIIITIIIIIIILIVIIIVSIKPWSS